MKSAKFQVYENKANAHVPIGAWVVRACSTLGFAEPHQLQAGRFHAFFIGQAKDSSC